MPEMTLARGKVRELSEFEAALTAALGDKYGGAVMQGGDVRLILSEDATAADRQLAEATFAQAEEAIDVKTPPPSVVREQRRKAYGAALQRLDVASLRERTANANSVPALRAEIDALWAALGQMAVLMGLNDSEMGDEA